MRARRGTLIPRGSKPQIICRWRSRSGLQRRGGSLPLVNVSLFGWTYGSLIVRDGEGLLLEYSVNPGYLVVYTLGSDMVEIDYSTSDLTNKQGPSGASASWPR